MLHNTIKTVAIVAVISWTGVAFAQGIGDPGVGPNGSGPNAANGPGPNGSNDGMVRRGDRTYRSEPTTPRGKVDHMHNQQ
jgi:hypothetical protein